MDDVTSKDVTEEELQFLYKKAAKERSKKRTNIIKSETIKGAILFILIIGVSALILSILK